jgi:putative membrane protein
MRIAAWQKLLKADAAFVPQQDDIARLRRFMLAEVHVFALIPVFAAAMARGVGYH